MNERQHRLSQLLEEVSHELLSNGAADVDAINQTFFALVSAAGSLMPHVDSNSLEVSLQADKLIELLQAQTQLAAVVIEMVGNVDASMIWSVDGSRSCAAWMERKSGRDRKECNRMVRTARELRAAPVVAGQFSLGKLSERHVQLLTQTAKKAPEAFVEAENWLVAQADNLTVREFGQLLDHWHTFANPERAEADAAARYDKRAVHMSAGFDGVGWLDVQFEPIGFEVFSNALSQIQSEFWHADWALAREQFGEAATAADLCRSDAQRRYDAMVEMASRSMSQASSPRMRLPAFVTVHVDHKTLTGRVCELGSGVQVTPGEVARLLSDADIRIERAVFGSTGQVINYGRSRRLFVGYGRRAIQIRDRFCVYPGCTVPAEHCQVDHIQPWSEGGPTNLNNGQLLCPKHHRNKSKHPPKSRLSPPEPQPPPEPQSPLANTGSTSADFGVREQTESWELLDPKKPEPPAAGNAHLRRTVSSVDASANTPAKQVSLQIDANRLNPQTKLKLSFTVEPLDLVIQEYQIILPFHRKRSIRV